MPANLVPRMNKSGTIEPFPGVKVTQVHAEHSSEMILKDPATGEDTSYAAGEPVGLISWRMVSRSITPETRACSGT
jgi:hypothetical protein